MRKTALVLSLGAVCVAILSGCKSKNKYKAPTTAYEKVQVALDGVEKSFANYKSSDKTNSGSKKRSALRIGQSDPTGALTDISKLYYDNDSLGDKIDDLEYNQPPMIQLQCLKKVFESAGTNYSFGTKYYDTVSGDVYFDLANGEKKSGEEYKYNYNLTLSMALDIDASDLITADVGVEIELTKGETTLHTNWYLTMILDYEMEKESPTYTLTMYTDNEESALSYLEYGNTYEYDFVDMKNGRINEWRKFCYEINTRMVKDATHSTFSDYASDSKVKSQIASSKWYKNANLRSIKTPNKDRTNNFIRALFDKLSLNTTDINGAAFFAKEGTKNTSVASAYRQISDSFGEDLIYNLVTGNENREKVITSIHIMNYDVSTRIYDISITEDISFETLFSGKEPYYGIWYFDKNELPLDQVDNLDDIHFRFSIPYGTNEQSETFDNSYDESNDHYLNLKDGVIELYKKLGKENYLQRKSIAYLFIYEGLMNAVISITLGESLHQLIDLYFKGFFPDEITDLGFPTYEGNNCLYEYSDDEMILSISKTTQEELDAFKCSLEETEWTKEIRANQTSYTKLNDVKNKLYRISIEENPVSIQKGNVRIFYSIEDIDGISWPRNTIKEVSNNIFDLPEPVSKNGYYVLDETLSDTIVLKNFDEDERAAFIASLESVGAKPQGEKVNSINICNGNKIYNFALSENGNDILFTYKPNDSKTYPLYELTIKKDGTDFGIISLNDEINGYSFRAELTPGVYTIVKHNLVDDSNADMAMEGHDLECYQGKLDYSEKELTVNETVEVVFYMDIEQTTYIRLLDNSPQE